VPDHNTNLYVTLYGRAAGFTGLSKFNSDLTRMSNQFGLLNTKAQRQAALTEMALGKQATSATTAADVAVRSQGRIQAALATTSDRAERMQRRQTLITQQQLDLRSRAEQGFYDKNLLRYTQLREKLKLQQEWITADLAKQLAKRDALVAASDDAQALSAAKASAKMAALQDVRNAAGATAAANAGFGAQLGKFAMNPYVQGAAVTVGAGAYAAYKLSNFYAGFQGITQTTGANTNMSPAALKAYRGMLPGFRNKFPGSLADLNSAFFHALSLGFRGKGGMPNASTRDFVREVMLSALPSGANPGDVTNLLGGAINAYRNNRGVPKGAVPDWFMNVMHATGATGNMSVEELAQYFGPVMALAAASGSRNSLRQSGAMVDTLTQMGFTPQRANTNVAAIWQKLENAPSKAKNELAQLYRSTGGRVNLWGDFTQQGLAQKGAFGVIGDLRNALARGDITRQQILTLFPGTRGGQGMLSLLSQGGATRMATNYGFTSASSAQGQTQAQYAGWMGTRGGQTAERNALLGQAGLWAGQGTNKEITTLTSDFNKATIAVGGFVKNNQALIYGSAHAIGSLAAFETHMNPLYIGFKTLNGVVGVTATLFQHGFVSALQDAGSRIKTAFLTPLGDLTNFIKPWGGKLVSIIGSGITTALPGLKSGPLHATVVAIKNALGGLNAWAGHLGASIASGLGSQFNAYAPSWVKHALGISTGSSTRLLPHMNVSAAIRAAGPAPKGTPAGFPNPHAFGLTAPSWYRDSITNPYSAKITAQDSMGTTALGGGPAAHDFNYGVPVGSTVRLPIAAKLLKIQLISDKTGYGGWYVYFQAKNGGVFFYEHFNDVMVHTVGKTYPAGTVVGHSGQPTGSWGSGPQMSITADARATAALRTNNSNAAVALPSTGGHSLPTPPLLRVGVGSTGKGPAITPWEKNNWRLLTNVAAAQHIPMGALLAILGNESSGGMNKAAGANLMQVTSAAARQIGFTGAYGTNVSASLNAGAKYFEYLLNGPAHGDLWTAFEMYNGSGPGAIAYANKAYAAANAFGLGHQVAAAKAAARAAAKLSATPETGREGGALPSGAYGAAGRSVPVHIIGRCAAEAAANVHRKKTADHAQAIAHHTLTSAQILAKIYDHMTKHPSGGGRQGRDNPKVIGLHQSPMPGY
jgi:hypothetical protein